MKTGGAIETGDQVKRMDFRSNECGPIRDLDLDGAAVVVKVRALDGVAW